MPGHLSEAESTAGSRACYDDTVSSWHNFCACWVGQRPTNDTNQHAGSTSQQRKSLLGRSGSVVGIVAGKLNTIQVAETTSETTENVNFAVNLGTIQSFLDSHAVPYV